MFASLDAALERAEAWAREEDAEELMLIGGAQLYELGLAQAERLYLTRVGISPQGDAYFLKWPRLTGTCRPPSNTWRAWKPLAMCLRCGIANSPFGLSFSALH